MASLGLTDEDYVEEAAADPGIEVWPENETAVDVYMAMRTQWRVCEAGPLGLDYGALPTVLRLVGVARKDWPSVFEDLRLMEITELSEIRKRRD